MILRQTMAVATGIALLFLVGASGDGAPGFEIAYFPEAVYRGDRAVFVIDAPAGQDIVALLNGAVLDRKTVEGAGVEWSLSVDAAGSLVFRGLAGERAFKIVAPDTETTLTERDGYLYADGTPAILMACQRHPPKKDRRWQTFSFLTRRFRDPRPVVRKARLVLSSPEKNEFSAARMPTQTFAYSREENIAYSGSSRAFGKVTEPMPDSADPEKGVWSRTVVPVADSEIHAFITHADGWPVGDALALALSAADLVRGAEWVRHRVKLEWCLQRLSHRGHAMIFLVGPSLDETQRHRFAPWLAALETAAAGHETRLVFPPSDKRTESFPDWFAAVRDAMSAHVRFGR